MKVKSKVERIKKTMTGFWAWSLGIHAALFALMISRQAPVWTPPPERVEIDFNAIDELTPAPTRPKTAAKKAARQIVEQDQRANDEIDPNAAYLSAFNQKVVRQTRAERSGAFNNRVHGGQVGEAKAEANETKPVARAKTTTRAPGELPSLADLLPKYEARVGQVADANHADQPAGDPTRTDDYLKDVAPGLQTMISTREFVYYAYYNRIKAALRSQWEPEVRERVNVVLRQGRTLAAAKDRITQVVVTLDGSGELVAVDVITRSGVHDLDDAAVQAFRRAAPFPNPPKGMLEGDGTVKIRWDFVLEV